MRGGWKLALVVLGGLLLLEPGSLGGRAGVARAAVGEAPSKVMVITFDGAGRSKKTCDPNAECISAKTQASWHREWTLAIPGGAGITPVKPVILGYFSDQSTWKPNLGRDCDVTYKDSSQYPNVSANDVGGQLQVSATVPLTEEVGQTPQVTPPGERCIGVSVSGNAGPVSRALKSLEIASAEFGSYQDWAKGLGATNRIVSGSYSGLSVGGVATPGTGVWDWVGALSVCEGGCVRDPVEQELGGWVELAAYLLGKYGNLSTIPSTIAPASGQLTGQESIEGGIRKTSGIGAKSVAPVLLATIHQHFTKNTRTALKPVFTAQGRKTLAQLKGPATFIAKFTFTPSRGSPVTRTLHFKLTPAASEQPTPVVPTTSGRITSVKFSGSPANPSITVHGTNLGKRPQPNPAGHLSGQNGCPVIAGDTGYDYGTSLYIAVPAKNWSGGRYRPSLNETDCIDLVVTKFTPSEVDFQFGAPYKHFYPTFALDPSDGVQIAVNRATFTTTVKYG